MSEVIHADHHDDRTWAGQGPQALAVYSKPQRHWYAVSLVQLCDVFGWQGCSGYSSWKLFQPGLQFVQPEFFNQMTTNHGLIMVFGAIMPAFVGLANWLIPMQVGLRRTWRCRV